MKKRWFALLCILAVSIPLVCFAGEGDPLLSVDDLLELEDSYTVFLKDLQALLIERELLSEEDAQAWFDAQMGDYLQNGGYGSMLIQYTPGILDYSREEDTLILLHAEMDDGSVMEISTTRRYTPEDGSLSGLMLSVSVSDADGLPMDVRYTFRATGGLFLKWDALTGAYTNVGTTAESDGEVIVWSSQTPAEGAKDAVITITTENAQTGVTLYSADLTLHVDGSGYAVSEDSLQAVSLPEAPSAGNP